MPSPLKSLAANPYAPDATGIVSATLKAGLAHAAAGWAALTVVSAGATSRNAAKVSDSCLAAVKTDLPILPLERVHQHVSRKPIPSTSYTGGTAQSPIVRHTSLADGQY